ncbi:hypothetical protein FQZ97_656460 [compost metagenome]
MQHHDHFVGIAGQGAAHGAGQDQAEHHVPFAEARRLGRLDFTRGGFLDGAGQHFHRVGTGVERERQHGAEEGVFEPGEGPVGVPQALHPFQLRDAVVDEIDLDQQRRAAHHIGEQPDRGRHPAVARHTHQRERQRQQGARDQADPEQFQGGDQAGPVELQILRLENDGEFVHQKSPRLTPTE